MKLSIIIAVYNEKDSLLEVIEKIQQVKIGLEKEIIVVDGCSTDGTREILQNLHRKDVKVIFEEQKNGKGMALQLGFKHATGEIILIQDADLEIDPFEYPYLLKPILESKSEVVYGSRFMNGRSNANLISYLGNQLMTQITNILFGTRLTDIETCYKVFKSELIKNLNFKCKGFDFDAELTTLFLKNKIKIIEIPISYNPRNKKDGKKLHWTAALTSLSAIVKGRF